MDNKSLGALIRKKRTEKHMTQTQLADLLHVSANAVSKWELGKNSVDLQNLNTLTNVLDIPLDQLSCRQPETAAQAVPLPEPAPAIKAEKKSGKKKIFLLSGIGAALLSSVAVLLFVWLDGRHSFAIYEEHFNTYDGRDACYLIAEYDGRFTAEIYNQYADMIRGLYADYFDKADVIIVLYYPDYQPDKIFSIDTADAVTVLLPDPISTAFPTYAKTPETSLRVCHHDREDADYETSGKNRQPGSATLPVTRYVACQGSILPPKQNLWQETADGINYSGTLTLFDYTYTKKDNLTTATYKGALTYFVS